MEGLIFMGMLYFLPTIIAFFRSSSKGLYVFILNMLLGWTLIGWIAAFYMATT